MQQVDGSNFRSYPSVAFNEMVLQRHSSPMRMTAWLLSRCFDIAQMCEFNAREAYIGASISSQSMPIGHDQLPSIPVLVIHSIAEVGGIRLGNKAAVSSGTEENVDRYEGLQTWQWLARILPTACKIGIGSLKMDDRHEPRTQAASTSECYSVSGPWWDKFARVPIAECR